MVAAKRFSYEPEQLSHDLFCIPLPLFDGSPVNSFVAIGAGGVWLIDGGLGTEHCQATLAHGLRSLGYSLADVRGLLITHGHGDHVGAAEAVLANGKAISRLGGLLKDNAGYDLPGLLAGRHDLGGNGVGNRYTDRTGSREQCDQRPRPAVHELQPLLRR